MSNSKMLPLVVAVAAVLAVTVPAVAQTYPDGPVKFLVPRDSFTAKSYTISNEDEGGDFGVITLNVRNNAA